MNAPIGVSRSAFRVAVRRIVSAEPDNRRTSRRLSGSVSAIAACLSPLWPSPPVRGSGPRPCPWPPLRSRSSGPLIGPRRSNPRIRRGIKTTSRHRTKGLLPRRMRPGNHDDLSSRDERSILPRCHPHSAMPLSWPTRQALVGPGSVALAATPADRCCPVSLALCAGAYWRALEARGLVRRLTGPFAPVAAPASTNRWVSVPATGRYSSRSSPVFAMWRESTG